MTAVDIKPLSIADAIALAHHQAAADAPHILERHVVPEGDAFRRQIKIGRLREERRRLEAKTLTRPCPTDIARLVAINDELNGLYAQTLTSLATTIPS